MKLITCQHEWVDACTTRYRCEPPTGYHFEDAHYPLSEKQGETNTIPLWYPDHIVQGILQTLECEYPCIYTGKRDIERPIIELIYPEYLELYDKAYKMCQSYSGRKRGLKVHSKKDERGKSVLGVHLGKLMAQRNHAKRDEKGRSLHALRLNEAAHAEKDERGKSALSVRAANNMNKSLYIDPDHPELGQRNPGNLVQMQKARGLPYGPENRVRVY
jgi:hypothetical protein